MTDAVQEAEITQAPRATLPWIVGVVVVVALFTGATVAVAWTGGGGDRGAAATAAPSASWMQDACQEWMGTYTGTAPPSSWCASMWSWMQTAGPGMMGMMWWGNADQFRTACISGAGATADTRAWCDAMATWTQGRASHYGGWGPWMMRPSP